MRQLTCYPTVVVVYATVGEGYTTVAHVYATVGKGYPTVKQPFAPSKSFL
ncbi:hypothetical protein [Neobacillus sp. Marseille-QA0830]